MEMLKIWSNPNVDPPSILIVTPRMGGVRHLEFAEELAMAHYTRSGIKRSFRSCYISLIYPGENSEKELLQFYDSTRVVAEKYNHFIGTFCIDLSNYFHSIDGQAFQRLLNYVDAHKLHIKFIFVACTNDKAPVTRIYFSLRNHLRIALIDMGFSDNWVYVEFVMESLRNMEMQTECGIDNIIAEYIDAIAQKKHFSGFDTVSRFIDELVYEARFNDIGILTKDALVGFKDALITADTEPNTIKRIGF
jgi:hypothetical protein